MKTEPLASSQILPQCHENVEYDRLMVRRWAWLFDQISFEQFPAAAVLIGKSIELQAGHSGSCRHHGSNYIMRPGIQIAILLAERKELR